MDDLARLRHAIRDELVVQCGIARVEVDQGTLDDLAALLVARIDYGFDVSWNPKWVKPGDAHAWVEGGEAHIECVECDRETVHSTEQDAVDWYRAHIESGHR